MHRVFEPDGIGDLASLIPRQVCEAYPAKGRERERGEAVRNVVSSYRDDLQKDTVYIARKKCITGRTSTLVWIYGDSRGAFLTGVSLKPAKNFESYSSFHWSNSNPSQRRWVGENRFNAHSVSAGWLAWANWGNSWDISSDILFPRHYLIFEELSSSWEYELFV